MMGLQHLIGMYILAINILRTPTIREGDTYYLDFHIMETGGINYGKYYATANFKYDVFLINEHTIIGSIPSEVTLRGGHN